MKSFRVRFRFLPRSGSADSSSAFSENDGRVEQIVCGGKVVKVSIGRMTCSTEESYFVSRENPPGWAKSSVARVPLLPVRLTGESER